MFRNLYVFNLKWERVNELLEGAAPLFESIRRQPLAFDAFLEQAAVPGDART